MSQKEETLKKEYQYKGRVIRVRLDDAKLPDGRIVQREVVEHPGGVAIALENADGNFFLVSQWRYAQEKELVEFPAGKLELGENPSEAIKREVVEETGYDAKDYIDFGEFVPTGAYGQEKVHLYYAKANKYLGQHLDDDEHLDVILKSLDEIIDEIMSGEITDGKTIALAFKVKEYKRRNG